MEQIELVIRLTEEQYANVRAELERGIHPSRDARWTRILLAIANGTLLPKGHGDLIDRSKLEMSDIAPEPWYRPMMAYTEWEIDDADVVVGADKEGAEE